MTFNFEAIVAPVSSCMDLSKMKSVPAICKMENFAADLKLSYLYIEKGIMSQTFL